MPHLLIDQALSKLAKDTLSFGDMASLDRSKTLQTEYSSPAIDPRDIKTDEHLQNTIHNFTLMFEIIRDEPVKGRKVDAAEVHWCNPPRGDYGYFKAMLYSKESAE